MPRMWLACVFHRFIISTRMYEFIHTTDHAQCTWHRRLPTSSYLHVYFLWRSRAIHHIQHAKHLHATRAHAPCTPRCTNTNRTGPDRTGPGLRKIGPDRTATAQLKSDRTGPGHAGGRAGPDRTKTHQNRTGLSGPVRCLHYSLSCRIGRTALATLMRSKMVDMVLVGGSLMRIMAVCADFTGGVNPPGIRLGKLERYFRPPRIARSRLRSTRPLGQSRSRTIFTPYLPFVNLVLPLLRRCV